MTTILTVYAVELRDSVGNYVQQAYSLLPVDDTYDSLRTVRLPDGYYVGEQTGGGLAIYRAADHQLCTLDRANDGGVLLWYGGGTSDYIRLYDTTRRAS